MILCIEDDSSIRDLMIYALTSAGFHAAGYPDGASLFHVLEAEKPQLILLDLMLVGEDGISILKKLKSDTTTADIPVIIASAKGSEYDKVLGLDLGADDYLAKPFGMMEMVSRVRAVLRRSLPTDTSSQLRIASLELNPREHTVYLLASPMTDSLSGPQHKKKLSLTLKEFELLHLFMKHPGIVFTRDTLLGRIWDSDYLGGTRTVDVHVATLRTKLEDAGSLIKTVRGVGYKMEDTL